MSSRASSRINARNPAAVSTAGTTCKACILMVVSPAAQIHRPERANAAFSKCAVDRIPPSIRVTSCRLRRLRAKRPAVRRPLLSRCATQSIRNARDPVSSRRTPAVSNFLCVTPIERDWRGQSSTQLLGRVFLLSRWGARSQGFVPIRYLCHSNARLAAKSM